METVLGLSVTATNVQTVLVEGRAADGATLEHDEFDVFAGGVSAARASEQVAEAVLSIAKADGHRLHSIGVTWSDDADLEASLVMDSLAEMGFSNVVAVRSPHAAEALARSIGRVIGYQRTAVCVIEPDNVILALFDTVEGEIATMVSHAIDSDEQLAQWMDAAFERHDWRPEGLFVVGSVGGLDALAHWLEHQLELPVFDPPEAELALAHGAALASASGAPRADQPDTGMATAGGRRFPVGPVSMLVAGAVTFVVSVTLAVSPHLTPERTSLSVPAQSEKSPVTPPVAKVVAPPAAPIAPASLPEAPAPVPEVVEEPPAAVPEAPVEDVPAFEPGPSIEAVVPPAPAAPVEPINPIAPPPAVVAPPPPPAPVEPPRLRDRILDKIPGLNRFN